MDTKQRQLALDTRQSFIVQAPAGSGKTELLIQRYLALLATVQQPEEIIAITFTRKAAKEMRDRIIQALSDYQQDIEPLPAHQQITHRLASQVIAQNRLKGWEIQQYPNRLQVQTIDAFCASIIRQMPILSRHGIEINVAENPQQLYLQATRDFMTDLDQQKPWYKPLMVLLLHLDNQHPRLERLFVRMLAEREHWLPHIIAGRNTHQLRSLLQRSLVCIIEDSIQQLSSAIPVDITDELLDLTRYAAKNRQANNPSVVIVTEFSRAQLLETSIKAKSQWQTIAELLLTKNCLWRKQITHAIGFPPPSSTKDKTKKSYYGEMKNRLKTLLESLQSHESFRHCLQRVIECPPPVYSDQQWQITKALIQILPILSAHLKYLFTQRKVVDFTEINTAALQALGEEDSPTELTLNLDYRIKHILVDEFQDTSINQFHLLEKLTLGWQFNDGRTLFIVGDPMQSIYRFRKAEVSLFLLAKHHGIGSIKLEYLSLTQNFRSHQCIVEWINHTFKKIFPDEENLNLGAIKYAPSVSTHSYTEKSVLQFHSCVHRIDEAEQIINLIRTYQQKTPQLTIAILVRMRNQLAEIIPALKKSEICYQGQEIESLAQRTIIQDLLALTKGLLHLGDQSAWLSILRAPWCGLSLQDLHTIVTMNTRTTIMENIQNNEINAVLTHDGRTRVKHISNCLVAALQQRQRMPLPLWIEKTWHELGGYNSLLCEQDYNDAQTFFMMLEKFDFTNFNDIHLFGQTLAQTYASSLPNPEISCHVMTIHKAKGLEFDVVILPGLEQVSKATEHSLLMYSEWMDPQGKKNLIMAPIKTDEQSQDPIYEYLRREDKKKEYYETSRLLYVAATRAKKRLHFLASFNKTDQQTQGQPVPPPPRSSLLGQLWPCVKDCFNAKATNTPIQAQAPQIKKNIDFIYRLPLHCFQDGNKKLNGADKGNKHSADNGKIWNKKTANMMGILIHEQLKWMGMQGLEQWTESFINSKKPFWQNYLHHHGIIGKQLQHHMQRIQHALLNIISDPKAHWILNQKHKNHQCEYPITAKIGHQLIAYIIDRTFIDSDDICWIIDYKTSEFLEQEINAQLLKTEKQKHLPQLSRYAQAMALKEIRKIKMGIYYPFNQLWIDCGTFLGC